MALCREGPLKYKSTESWKQRFFRISTGGLTCYPVESKQEDLGDPVFTVHIGNIEAVHVYLGGRFDVVATKAGSLPLLVDGGGQAARMWADAIHAAGSVFTLEETTRLRCLFRPALLVEQTDDGNGTGMRVTLDRAVLTSMMHAIDLSRDSEDQSGTVPALQGLCTKADSQVVATTPAGEALLRALVENVAEVEVIEAWENGHRDKSLLTSAEPPEWQQADGSKMSSAQMRSGLHPGWMWICDWTVDRDPTLFGPDGWQYASTFLHSQWHAVHTQGCNVCRRRWFRVQAFVPSLALPDQVEEMLGIKQDGNAPMNEAELRKLPADIAEVLCDPLLAELFGEYLQRSCVSVTPLLRFCLDAERCLNSLSGSDGSMMLNDLVGVYLIPGRKDCIWNVLDQSSMPEDVEDDLGAGGATNTLLRRAQRYLEENQYFAGFVNSPECALYAKGLRHSFNREDENRVDLMRPQVGTNSVEAAQSYDFQLIKINERGKRQERTLHLDKDGYSNLRQDTVRVRYDSRDIHGMHLSKDDPLSFEVVTFTRYRYECTSTAQRFLIAQAFEALKLGQEAADDLLRSRATTRNDGEAISRAAKGRPMSKADFDMLTRIGRGGMGKILKVRHRASNQIFAMKVQKVAALIKNEQMERAKTELQILCGLDHPFLVKLHHCFVDHNQICMCLDFCDGGDLFHHLKRIKGRRLHYPDAGFYIAEVTLALEYLHRADIVHRDLKPENILIAADGHLKITDFGLSKTEITSVAGLDDEGTRATSLVGTKEYVSPEIIQHQAYGQAVDWWAVGVLFYELLTGRPPFDTKEGDLFNRIVTQPVRFPEAVAMPESAKALIRALLQKRPEERPSYNDVKAHAFYVSTVRLNWEALLRKEIKPPVKPDLTNLNFAKKHTDGPLESFVEQSPALPQQEAQSFNFTAAGVQQ